MHWNLIANQLILVRYNVPCKHVSYDFKSVLKDLLKSTKVTLQISCILWLILLYFEMFETLVYAEALLFKFHSVALHSIP